MNPEIFSSGGTLLGAAMAATPFFGGLAIPIMGAVGGMAGSSGLFDDGSAAREGRKQKKEAKQAGISRWRHDKRELERYNKYLDEKHAIDVSNYEQQWQYEVSNLQQNRDYQMSIRAFEHNLQLRAFDRSEAYYTERLAFNEQAEFFAYEQQNQYLQENLLALQFDETESLLQYTAELAGAQLEASSKKGSLELQRAKAKAGFDTQIQGIRQQAQMQNNINNVKTAFGKRDINVEALKAQGQLAARGATGKAMQGVEAEAGAAKAKISREYFLQQSQIISETLLNQQEAVNALVFTEGQINLDIASIDAKLQYDKIRLDAFLGFEKTKRQASKYSLMQADALARRGIANARKKADMLANADRMLEPALKPPLPELIIPPKRQFVEPFKAEMGPEPKGDARAYYKAGSGFVMPTGEAAGGGANYAQMGQYAAQMIPTLVSMFSGNTISNPSPNPYSGGITQEKLDLIKQYTID